ncbi:methyltransferase domain-containing protein [Candidatus Latescibacterota bacterium]
MPVEQINIGPETLRRMSALDRYNDWIIERIMPWVGDTVLEVGAGIGNISRYFLDRKRLILSDVNEEYLKILREKFGDHPNVSYERYNLEESASRLSDNKIDTIMALNVLEHIDHDVHALKEMASILSPGGHIILQLPAHKILYGSIDRNLAHFRRYTIREIRRKFDESGLKAECFFRMNMFGALGWFLYCRILKRPLLPEGPLSLFNKLTPVFMAVERTFPVPFGLSIIAVGRKED